jgi:cytidine deaminase
LIEELEVQRIARELIAQDARESEEPHGQNVRDAFPLGDVFIDASSRVKCEESLRRFIHLLFGNNEITPTRDEYGMYMAKSASLRSSDLSRQVGAAIFRATGEIATLGCNEVPKAGGGTYWGGDEPDGRDFVAGFDPNERQRQAILVDLIERLRRGQHLSDELLAAETSFDVSKKLLEVKGLDSVKESKIMDLIEFGRVIHAEMSAISDASRNGVAIGGGSLFCTTFPCHLCATNIIAAGLRRVVYLEPYPKSYASNLHTDSIVVDADNPGDRTKVHFDAFIGVSPYRYRDLFEKSRRKSSGGSAQRWQGDTRRPLIEVYFPQYSKAEQLVMSGFKAGLARLQPTKARLPESPTEEPASKPASTPRPPGSLSKPRKR